MSNISFLMDDELDLNEKDLLNTMPYANTLQQMIEATPADKSFTIGLLGERGSGKSSIINTVEKNIGGWKNSGYVFIKYDARKYSQDSFRRMFLFKVQEALEFNGTELFEGFYLDTNTNVKVERKIDLGYLLTVGVFSIIVVGLLLLTEWESEWKITLSVVFSLIGLVIATIRHSMKEYKVSVNSPRMFAAEQFESCFEEMVQKSSIKTNIVNKLRKRTKGDRHKKNVKKIVVVIDNVDRCSSDLAYELLTNIKNFLNIDANVVFVVPVDDTAIINHIKHSKSTQHDEKSAKEFLRKFFDVTLRINTYRTEELFEYTKKVLEKHGLHLEPITVHIACRSHASNPRRLVQFFNNLQSIIQQIHNNDTIGIGFEDEHQAVIASLLVIKEEWNWYASALTHQPWLIKKDNRGLESIFTGDKIPTNSINELKSFLSATRPLFKEVNILDIETILSNFVTHEKLNQNIRMHILDGEIEEVIEYIKEDADRLESVLEFTQQNFDKAKQKGILEFQGVHLLDLIVKIFEQFEIDAQHLLPIQASLKEVKAKDLVQKMKYIEGFILMGKALYNIKNTFFLDLVKKYLINFTITKEEGTEEKKQTRENAMQFFVREIQVPIYLKETQNKFFNLYQSSSFALAQYEIPTKNYQYLFTPDNVKNIISEIKDVGDEKWRDTILLLRHIPSNQGIITELLNMLNKRYPNLNNQNFEAVKMIVSTLYKDFLAISQEEAKDRNPSLLTNIYTRFLTARPYTDRHISVNKSYIDELAERNEKEAIQDFISFCSLLYKLSGGEFKIGSTYQKFFNVNYKEYIYQELEQLSQDIVLRKDISSLVLSDRDRSISFQKFFKSFALGQDPNGEHIVDEAGLRTPTQQLLQKVISDHENKKDIISTINVLRSNVRFKNTLLKLLTLRSTSEIKQLPNKWVKNLVDYIVENIDDYKNNPEILTIALQQGTQRKQIEPIVNYISTKFTSNQRNDIEQALKILESVKRFKVKAISKNLEEWRKISGDPKFRGRLQPILEKIMEEE